MRPDHQVGTGVDKSPRNGSLVSDWLAGVLLAPVRQDREDVDPRPELPDGIAHRIEIPGAEPAQPRLHAKLYDSRFAPASRRRLSDRVEREEAEAHAVPLDDRRAPRLRRIRSGSNGDDLGAAYLLDGLDERLGPVVAHMVVGEAQDVEAGRGQAAEDARVSTKGVTPLPWSAKARQ
jgi:hypothetical protein